MCSNKINRLTEWQLHFVSFFSFRVYTFLVPKISLVMIDWRSLKNSCSLTDPCYVQKKSRLTLSFTKMLQFQAKFVCRWGYLRFFTFPLIKRSIKAGSFNYMKTSWHCFSDFCIKTIVLEGTRREKVNKDQRSSSHNEQKAKSHPVCANYLNLSGRRNSDKGHRLCCLFSSPSFRKHWLQWIIIYMW